MFDSLSAVAEITGVDYDQWLTDFYGNDEAKKQTAIDAARAVQAQELNRVARQVRDNERRLASQVDAVAALTLLQRDLFARINPAIVEAYLDRLAAAGVLHGRTHRGRHGVPPIIAMRTDFARRSEVARMRAIATSGEALRDRRRKHRNRRHRHSRTGRAGVHRSDRLGRPRAGRGPLPVGSGPLIPAA